MFTRQHYNKISSIINESVKQKDDINILINKLGKEFKEDNPNFKPKKFIEACYK